MWNQILFLTIKYKTEPLQTSPNVPHILVYEVHIETKLI